MRKVNTVPASQNCTTSYLLFLIRWVQSFYVSYWVVLMSFGNSFAPPKAMELICELPGVQDMACIAGAPMQVSVLEPQKLANLKANCTRTELLSPLILRSLTLQRSMCASTPLPLKLHLEPRLSRQCWASFCSGTSTTVCGERWTFSRAPRMLKSQSWWKKCREVKKGSKLTKIKLGNGTWAPMRTCKCKVLKASVEVCRYSSNLQQLVQSADLSW